MSMKTMLIPTEQRTSMSSTLETALLLARRFDSYVEGFALQPALSELLAVDIGGGFAPESFKQDRIEDAQKTKAMFESFMHEHGVPRSDSAISGLSFGWLDDAPEGEGTVGSYGRVFDLIVLGRPDPTSFGLDRRGVPLKRRTRISVSAQLVTVDVKLVFALSVYSPAGPAKPGESLWLLLITSFPSSNPPSPATQSTYFGASGDFTEKSRNIPCVISHRLCLWRLLIPIFRSKSASFVGQSQFKIFQFPFLQRPADQRLIYSTLRLSSTIGSTARRRGEEKTAAARS